MSIIALLIADFIDAFTRSLATRRMSAKSCFGERKTKLAGSYSPLHAENAKRGFISPEDKDEAGNIGIRLTGRTTTMSIFVFGRLVAVAIPKQSNEIAPGTKNASHRRLM